MGKLLNKKGLSLTNPSSLRMIWWLLSFTKVTCTLRMTAFKNLKWFPSGIKTSSNSGIFNMTKTALSIQSSNFKRLITFIFSKRKIKFLNRLMALIMSSCSSMSGKTLRISFL